MIDGVGDGVGSRDNSARSLALTLGAELSRAELLEFYVGKIAKWQIPDDVLFRQSIPIGPTGKVLKTELRQVLEAG